MAYVDGKRSVDKSSDAAEHPIMFCDSHPRKQIRWQCSDHDQLFCDHCRTVTHRACLDVKSIQELAKSIQVMDLSDIERSLRLMKKRIDNLNKSSMQIITDIRAKTKQSEAEARKLKAKIVKWADDLEKNMFMDIRRTETQALNDASELCKECNRLITQVDNDVKVAKETKSILDKSDRFIAEYKLSKTLTDMTKSESIIERETPKVDINFIPNPVIIDILNDVRQMGTLGVGGTGSALSVPGARGIERSIGVGQMGTLGVGNKASALSVPGAGCIERSIGDMNIGSSTEVKVKSTNIMGSAFMPDGRLVLAGHNNNNLLLLDKDFHQLSELQPSSRPWDVAVTSDTDVIVTLPNEKTLLYVSVGVKLRADRRITTHKLCFGVAVRRDDVYVSVCDVGGGNGEVHVLDRGGAVRRRVGVDAGGRGVFKQPEYIAVSTSGLLYVSDYGTGTVYCYSSAGDVVYHVHVWDMKGPRGLIALSGGQLLVCCTMSHKVLVLADDGSQRRELLSSSDGLVFSRSISYRNSDGTLIVTMQNPDGPSALAFKLI